MTLETCLDILRDCQHQTEEFRTGEFVTGEFVTGLVVGALLGIVLVKAWKENHPRDGG